MRFRFITATPLNVRRGSGTYVGIRTLAGALTALGHEVQTTAPAVHLPVFTLERLLFNATLRAEPGWDVAVGFDMDGYRIAGRGNGFHVASLKGVIADEFRNERGATYATMRVQAHFEAVHCRRADLVIATSRYSAGRAAEFYNLRSLPAVVPELIDLPDWRRWLAANPAAPAEGRFTVLFVGRLYRRKRANLLVEAAAQLRGRIPGLEIRIVGDGPCAAEWHSLAARLGTAGLVRFLGEVPRSVLAAEYNRCDVFCLPSVQEGFGIVFLEAMAAGRAIVAARAAAVPATVPHAVLVQPDSAEALAEGIFSLYHADARRAACAAEGLRRVEEFDAPRVARAFVKCCGGNGALSGSGE